MGDTQPSPGNSISPSEPLNPYGLSLTKRLVVPAAEELLFQQKVTYGEGHITLVDYMGGDKEVERVATAGHMSTIFPEKPELPEFLEHLVASGIKTPFKAVQFKFTIQCSIADALQIVYTKAASVNEYSGRYSLMLDSSFVPTAEYLLAKMNGKDTLAALGAAKIAVDLLAQGRYFSYQSYMQLVDSYFDVARELARAPLELNNDTKLFWKIELDDLIQFIVEKKALKKRSPDGKESSLNAYLELMEDAALTLAPLSTKALIKCLHRSERVYLTSPKDEDIIDATPLPAPWEPATTQRVTVPELEQLLFVPQPLLEHGAVQAVSYMGDNNAPVESARISYGVGTRRVSEDRNLIRYLLRHRHTTPFEHAELAVEGKAPLLVDPRQVGRHRTVDSHSFMGENLLGSKFFIPGITELKHQDRTNRQGRGKELDDEFQMPVLKILTKSYQHQIKVVGLLRELGVAEEDVRRSKGVGFYTFNWRTGDLWNWMHFLGLRLDAHAQKETRDYAQICARFLQAQAPDAYEAFSDYRLSGQSFSRVELESVSKLLSGGSVRQRKAVREAVENLDLFSSVGMTRTSKDGSEVLTREGEELRIKLKKLLYTKSAKY